MCCSALKKYNCAHFILTAALTFFDKPPSPALFAANLAHATTQKRTRPSVLVRDRTNLGSSMSSAEGIEGGVLPFKAVDFVLLVLAITTFCIASRSFVRTLRGSDAVHARKHD